MVRQQSNTATLEAPRLVMSYDDFLAWKGEETRAEWVDGEVIILEMPNTIHQRIIFFLARLVSLHADLFSLGEAFIAPYDMRLVQVRSLRQPDLVFVARDHRDRVTKDRLVGPADLVVEVISPDSVTRDTRDKLLEYQQAGISEYWLVDPRERSRRFEPYALGDRGVYQLVPLDARGRFRSTVLPGFWLDPTWLWQEPLPDPLRLLATIAPEALRSHLGANELKSDAK